MENKFGSKSSIILLNQIMGLYSWGHMGLEMGLPRQARGLHGHSNS